MTKNRGVPDYVRISTYLFIEEHEKSVGKTRGVVFNKFMTLLNRDLMEEKSVNIRLPHCWYRWGDEVVRYYLRPYTKWDHEDLGITTVAWRDGVPEDLSLSDPTVAEIRDYIRGYIEEYSDEDGWERAIDRLYEKAPYEFQNRYRMLRENLKGAVAGNYIQGYSEKLLTPLFNNAMGMFPSEFSSIKKEKNDFESVFKAAVETGARMEDIRGMAEEFWFLFCYHLRIDKRGHENVKKETLDVWRASIPWEKELYNRCLQDRAFSLKLGGTSRAIDTILSVRDARIKEFYELLDEFRAADRNQNCEMP